MLHKEYYRKSSVKENSGREPRAACRQEELIGNSDFDWNEHRTVQRTTLKKRNITKFLNTNNFITVQKIMFVCSFVDLTTFSQMNTLFLWYRMRDGARRIGKATGINDLGLFQHFPVEAEVRHVEETVARSIMELERQLL
jgi:hypothetical protein